MAATDPQTLMASAACYECGADPYVLQLYKLALLRQILLASNPAAMTDPQSLISQSSCFACLPPGQLLILEVALLAQIVEAGGTGGGGGGGQLLVYTTTDPTTDGILPTNPAAAALAYKRDGTGPIFVWNTVTLAWN